MRFVAAAVAVMFLVQVSPRHGLKAAPYRPDGDGLHPRHGLKAVPYGPVGDGLQTVPGNEGTWSEKARLGEQRTEAAVVFLNGKMYVLGGMARVQDSHTLNQEYDPATDRWRERGRPRSSPSRVGNPGRQVRV